MANSTRPSPTQAPAWWLEGGTEECPHCGQPYHLETERRCAACDAESCAHCLSQPGQHCPGCASEAPE